MVLVASSQRVLEEKAASSGTLRASASWSGEHQLPAPATSSLPLAHCILAVPSAQTCSCGRPGIASGLSNAPHDSCNFKWPMSLCVSIWPPTVKAYVATSSSNETCSVPCFFRLCCLLVAAFIANMKLDAVWLTCNVLQVCTYCQGSGISGCGVPVHDHGDP